jgi:hypothetical protein
VIVLSRIKNFFKKHSKRLGVMTAVSCGLMGSVGSFAAESTPTPIPSSGTFSLSVLQDLWEQGAGMIIDTINIIASQPLLVMLVIALPLVGLGIGLFSRIKHA